MRWLFRLWDMFVAVRAIRKGMAILLFGEVGEESDGRRSSR